MRRMSAALAAVGCAKLVLALASLAGATSPATAGRAVLDLVLVLDGLRPDAITPEETPNLWRLRQEGINFQNSHAVFPTVTRVNATAISTGTDPDRNGILGNRICVRIGRASEQLRRPCLAAVSSARLLVGRNGGRRSA